MAKYSRLTKDVRQLRDEIDRKWIRIIGISALLSIGVWMLLDPSRPKHNTVEKTSVYLMKEIWSWQAGGIIVLIALPFVILNIRRLIYLKGKVWIKWDNGYYFFDRKVRKAGLGALYDGNDLVLFYPEKDTCIRLRNYDNAPIAEYKRAYVENSVNCHDTFWSANENGFNVYHKGERLTDPDSEWNGNDLVVYSNDKRQRFILKDYEKCKDNKIRHAQLPGQNRNRIKTVN